MYSVGTADGQPTVDTTEAPQRDHEGIQLQLLPEPNRQSADAEGTLWRQRTKRAGYDQGLPPPAKPRVGPLSACCEQKQVRVLLDKFNNF